MRSFEIERPLKPVGPSSWDLVKVLVHLRGPSFEPLASKPLNPLTWRLCSYSLWPRPDEWATFRPFSFCVAFKGCDTSLSYPPGFMAKTGSEKTPPPRSFLVKSLGSICWRSFGGEVAVSCQSC